MSGGDSSSTGGHTNNCMELLQEVLVKITDENVAKTLKKGEELILSKEESNVVFIGVKTIFNELVGSIASMSIHEILDCLSKGYDLRGIVLENNDGKLIIEIRCIGRKA